MGISGERGRAVLVVALAATLAILIWGQDAGTSEPAGVRLGSDTPVVLIVLDELPTATLMTADGQRINRRRYPQIAGFASHATWYRDNVAGGDFTAWAVPSILTGNLANEQMLPTVFAQPSNLFTLLGPGRAVHSFEAVTELCPVSMCPDGHQGEFPELTAADEFIKAKFRPLDPSEIDRWIQGLPGGTGTLSFIHLKSPHLPLQFLPGGQVYPTGDLRMPSDMKVPGWSADEAAISFVQQRHLLQTGFTDRMVGRILRKVKRNGDFKRAMVIVTADHGVSFDPADLRRDITDTNKGAIANPPLIIKYPGQTKGVISTASTQAIDILPTIAERLGAKIPPTDGRPISQDRTDRVMTMSRDNMGQIEVTAAQVRQDREEVLATQYRRLGSKGLWKLGPRNGLIGRRPGRTGTKPAAWFKLSMPDSIKQADASRHRVPSLVGGSLEGIDAGSILALAWNGRIVATTRSFSYMDQIRFGAMAPPSVMKRGHNHLGLYLIRPDGDLRRIRMRR